MDEKGFLMGVPLRYKVICSRSRHSPRLTMDGSRDWVTVIETISGAGGALTSFIINKGTAHYSSGYAGLKKSDRALFGVSEKGWSNEKLALRWLSEIFEVETRDRYVSNLSASYLDN